MAYCSQTKIIMMSIITFAAILFIIMLGAVIGTTYRMSDTFGDLTSGREKFTGDKIVSESLGGYNRMCKVGNNGIWYDCSRGVGTRQYGPGIFSTTGFYEAPSNSIGMSGIPQPKTPACMAANCGRFDTPKNIKGCGCLGGLGACGCAGKGTRGCKAQAQ